MNEAAIEYAIQVLEDHLSEIRGTPKPRLATVTTPTVKRGRPAGRKLSEEAKAKIRAGQKKRWEHKAQLDRERTQVMEATSPQFSTPYTPDNPDTPTPIESGHETSQSEIEVPSKKKGKKAGG